MRLITILCLLLTLSACNGIGRGPEAVPNDAPEALPPTARILWFDATANFERLGTKEGVDRMIARTDSVGFTDIVIDVKPLSGETMYESEHAPRLRTFGGFTRTDSIDYVGYTIERARVHGLRVHLAGNTFSAGHKHFSTGPIFTTNPEWQTYILDKDNQIRPTTEIKEGYSAFVNPIREDVRNHQLALIREVVSRYRPDGYVIDRGRYDNLYSDFSPESRAAFEAHIGRSIENWPADIMTRTEDPAKPTRGPLFNEWIEWRASVIKSFFEEARQVVKEASPETSFGVYVGAWYPAYYELGVNWASSDIDPSQSYDWATSGYKDQSYAHTLDFIMTGNYYVEVTPQELAETNRAIKLDNSFATERDSVYNVESSIRDVERLVGGRIPTFPSIYVEQYKMASKPQNFEAAIRKVLEMKGGIMVFDLVHLERDGLWDVVARAFADYPPDARYPY